MGRYLLWSTTIPAICPHLRGPLLGLRGHGAHGAAREDPLLQTLALLSGQGQRDLEWRMKSLGRNGECPGSSGG